MLFNLECVCQLMPVREQSGQSVEQVVQKKFVFPQRFISLLIHSTCSFYIKSCMISFNIEWDASAKNKWGLNGGAGGSQARGERRSSVCFAVAVVDIGSQLRRCGHHCGLG